MTSLQVSNTSMSFLTAIPVFVWDYSHLWLSVSAKNGHEISYHPFSGHPCRREWATLFQASYLLLIVTSFAAGLAIAMIGPILNAYIKKKFPERFTTVVGIYSFGIGVGATLSVL